MPYKGLTESLTFECNAADRTTLSADATGTTGTDTMTGTSGSDTFRGSYEGDKIDCGAANDLIYPGSSTLDITALSNLDLWLNALDLLENKDQGVWTDFRQTNHLITKSSPNQSQRISLHFMVKV